MLLALLVVRAALFYMGVESVSLKNLAVVSGMLTVTTWVILQVNPSYYKDGRDAAEN